jgi:parallel beta-helix repeat protein
MRCFALWWMFAIALLIFIPTAFAQCVVPFDGMALSSSRVLCEGTFEAGNILVEGMGTAIECNGTILKGSGENAGFLIDFSHGVSVTGCTMEDFEVGMSVHGSKDVVLEGNTFLRNKIGIAEQDSSLIQRGNVFEGSERQDVLSIEGSGDEGSEELHVPSENLSRSAILEKQLVLRNPGASSQEIEEQVEELLQKAELSEELLDIQRTVIVDEEGKATTVTLSITPKEPLQDVHIYEGIPKCLAEYLSQVVFSDDRFEVIEKDPLIMWTFAEMEERSRLSYTVGKLVSEECSSLLTGFGIATVEVLPEKKAAETPRKSGKSGIAFGVIVVLFTGIILHRAISTHQKGV